MKSGIMVIVMHGYFFEEVVNSVVHYYFLFFQYCVTVKLGDNMESPSWSLFCVQVQP